MNPFLLRNQLLTAIICKHLWSRRPFAAGFQPLFPVAAFTEAISANPQIKGGNLGGGGMWIKEGGDKGEAPVPPVDGASRLPGSWWRPGQQGAKESADKNLGWTPRPPTFAFEMMLN